MIFILSMLLFLGPARAVRPELHAVATNERTAPSEPVLVEIRTLQDGAPVSGPTPTARMDAGQVQEVQEAGKGHWRVWAEHLPAEGTVLTVDWEGRSSAVVIPPSEHRAVQISGPTSVDGALGRTTSFTLEDTDGKPLQPDDLTMWSSEWKLTIENGDANAVLVSFDAGPSPFPRAVPVMVQHKRELRSQPFLTIVRLTARPTIPVKTEPGAEVSMEVGGRSYGPQIADDQGNVSFQARIEPGVTRASVSLKDRLGNQQTSIILLGGNTGPRVTMGHIGSLIEGGVPPTIYLSAVSPSGSPWVGEPPSCTGIDADSMHLIQDGLWTMSLKHAGNVDSRIECRAANGPPTSLVVPIEKSRATRLVLQTYPGVLSTDIPVAEVQAYVVNGVGERLPSGNIKLEAEFGSIVSDQAQATTVLRGRYDGSKATQQGEDLLRASWKRPPGIGGVWDMAIRAASPRQSQATLIDARAVDQGGRPLSNVPVELHFRGHSVTTMTGADGWTTHTFPWPGSAPAAEVEARAAGLTRRTIVVRNTSPLPAAGSPDLVTEVLVPIQPGRIHGVILNLTPRVLTNDGMVGSLEVHLEDQAGKRVLGQNVRLTASEGTVGPVTARPDGTYTAQYAPPIGMKPGTVRLTASTDDGRLSAGTNVEVIPRVVDWSVGPGVGYLLGLNQLRAEFFSGTIERRMPVPSLHLRLDASMYSVSIEEKDPLTGMDVRLKTSIFPMGIGASVQRGKGRFPLRIGGGAVIAPYSIQASFGGQPASSGVGWMIPGAAFWGGAGWRLAGGELFAEAKYLFLSAPGETLGWEGAMGGMVGTIGYKLLY